VEAFESRLAEECGRLYTEIDVVREQMIGLRTEVRSDMASLRSELHEDMAALRSELRADMQNLRVEVRSDLRVEVANARADLLKWSFLFWVGQVAAVTGLVSLLD
jgi:hypothetical protein